MQLVYWILVSSVLPISAFHNITLWSLSSEGLTTEVPNVQHQPTIRMTVHQYKTYYTYRELRLYIRSAFSILSFVTNGIVLKVLKKQKYNIVPHIYMGALAVCDILISCGTLWESIASKVAYKNDILYAIGRYTYIPLIGLDVGASIASALISMILSIDRFIALRYPFKYAKLCTTGRAKGVSIVFILVCCVVTTVYYPLCIQIRRERPDEPAAALYYTMLGLNPIFTKIRSYFEFILRFALPLVMMAVSNTATLVLIKKTDVQRRKLGVNHQDVGSSPKCLTITVGLIVVFFITQLPIALTTLDSIVFDYLHRGLFGMEMFIATADYLVKLNLVINFFVYYAFGKDFRHQFHALMACAKKDSSSTEATELSKSTEITLQSKTT